MSHMSERGGLERVTPSSNIFDRRWQDTNNISYFHIINILNDGKIEHDSIGSKISQIINLELICKLRYDFSNVQAEIVCLAIR